MGADLPDRVWERIRAQAENGGDLTGDSASAACTSTTRPASTTSSAPILRAGKADEPPWPRRESLLGDLLTGRRSWRIRIPLHRLSLSRALL